MKNLNEFWKNLFIQLEKEAQAINIASGIHVAESVAKDLESYKTIIKHCTEEKHDAIFVLEKIEELAAREVDERYSNPNDEAAFVLLQALKHLYQSGIDNSGKFSIGMAAVAKMKNSFWSPQVRHDNFLKNLYDLSKISHSDAIDEVYDTLPELLRERKFDKVNEIFNQIDVERVSASILYTMLNLTSRYINQLPSYREFWQKVNDRCMSLCETEPNEWNKERVDNLIGRFKDGPHTFPLYNPEEDDKPRKSSEEIFDEKLNEKIAFAKQIGDKDLEDILSYYKQDIEKRRAKESEFHRMRCRLGEDILEEKAVAALRAFANKLEQKGSHFMIHCELPNLPIFSGKDHVESYFSHIQITMVAGPLGG